MRGFLRLLDRLEGFMAALATLLLVAVTLAVCLEVFMRYALNSPLVWVVELSEYALLYICFLGTAWALREGHHVRIDLFLSAFSQRARRLFGVLSSLFGVGISVVFIVWGIVVTHDKFLSGAYKPTVVEFPGWLVTLIIPIGSVFLLLRFLRNLIEYATGARTDETGFDKVGE